MRNRENWAGYSGRIKRKSLGITFAIHCLGFFFIVGPVWQKKNVEVQKVFDIQVINMPESEFRIERKPVPVVNDNKTLPAESANSRKEKPLKREPRLMRPEVRKFSKETKEDPTPFSSQDFRESLISKVEKTESLPARERREASKKQPVKIEKIDNSLVEMRVPQSDVSIPEWYLALVQNKIKENWKTYNMLSRRTTTVSFRINSKGRIENISLELSSGNGSFDRSAIDAVKLTKDLPLFPAEIKQPYLDIVMEFNTEE
ncbi:MAG TPA: TonB family protein [bacterium]|nr:TonB family protein [bacterium]